ncbi:hypothetical protein [Marinactinospora rubrisoli]|uniref:Uncharacterized protein n=1 Tax=Marinactinospora rubrisoli TaxID=2715399 RepID=A0ABW2KNR1_9ACTN
MLVQDVHPDGIERIRVLPAWAGVSGREPTGGLRRSDKAVREQLLAEDPGLVVTALATGSPSPAQLDGAAELFGSFEWTGVHGRRLAEPLRSMLIGHIPADGTDRMRGLLGRGRCGAGRSG